MMMGATTVSCCSAYRQQRLVGRFPTDLPDGQKMSDNQGEGLKRANSLKMTVYRLVSHNDVGFHNILIANESLESIGNN